MKKRPTQKREFPLDNPCAEYWEKQTWASHGQARLVEGFQHYGESRLILEAIYGRDFAWDAVFVSMLVSRLNGEEVAEWVADVVRKNKSWGLAGEMDEAISERTPPDLAPVLFFALGNEEPLRSCRKLKVDGNDQLRAVAVAVAALQRREDGKLPTSGELRETLDIRFGVKTSSNFSRDVVKAIRDQRWI